MSSVTRVRAARVPAIAALLLTLLVAGTVSPQQAAVAADSVVLEGTGYGHGRGMSQHGARGAADAGLTWQQILAFYYPGTSRTTADATRIRVRLTTGTSTAVAVDARSGLAVDSGPGTSQVALPTGSSYTAWRLRRTSSGVVLESRSASGKWSARTVSASLGLRSAFRAPGNLRVHHSDGTSREVRGGEVRVAAAGSTNLQPVAAMDMEDYLRSVVPREMPASWDVQALRAQAVAARSYAAREMHDTNDDQWDTCDTTQCQVFAGVARYDRDGRLLSEGEHPRTDAAIKDTARVVLMHQGIPAFTQFSASNGGYSVAGNQPYLVAKADPYDGRVASQAWSATLTATDIARAYPGLGTLRSVTVVERDGRGSWGGRATSVRIAGSKGSTTVAGTAFRSALGLRSTLFRVKAQTEATRDWSGDGRDDLLAISGDGRLRQFVGRSGGGFSSAPQIGHGWNVMNAVIQVEDWDGRGRSGLIAREASTGRLFHYPAKTSTSFWPRVQIGHGWQVMERMLTVDWNDDGVLDILAWERGTGRLYLYPGRGDGRFLSRTQVGHGWEVMNHVMLGGDWRGDGLQSLVARDTSGRLWLYPANGRGTFQARSQIGSGWNGMSAMLSAGDWDQDAVPDILAVDGNGILWMYPGAGGDRVGSRVQVGSGWSGYRFVG